MKTGAPEGYGSVSIFLVLTDVEKELEFLSMVFDAQALNRVRGPDGSLRYAEARLGDSIIMMDKVHTGHPATKSRMHVWTDDVDALFERAVQHGASIVEEPRDQTHGNREAAIEDGQGNIWGIAERLKKLSNQEVERLLTAQRRKRL